jgi:hypothetical protein
METAFSNFDNTVRTYLQKTFNDLGLNYTHNQIFGVIFDGIKGIMQNIMFYIEDAFTEQNIYTAQRKQSVYSLAKISGYEPYYGAAATGTIYCKIQLANGITAKASRIYIENNSTVVNKVTNVIYTIILPTNYYIIDVSKPLITHEFKIVQGTYRTATYITNGTTLETINLSGAANYDSQYITVNVNGEEWTQVSNLYEMNENSKNYIVSTGYDNTVNIMFGNGVHGMIPAKGSSVVIKYINHLGTSGNINTFDNYNIEFFSTGTDNMGNTVNINDYCKLSINNMVTGGTNPDSIEFVKKMIGYNSRSNVLASEENYKLFLNRFSFIGQTSVWSEENTSCIIISALTNYYIANNNMENYFITDINKFYLDDHQKRIIFETLNNSNKTLTGVSVKFQDPVIRKYALLCYIKLNTVYNQDDVKENIQNIIANYFVSLDKNVQFISKADIIKEIMDNDDNIEALDITFISELAEQTFYDGYYNKYYLQYINKGYTFTTKKVFYEKGVNPGLDAYGNIQLDTKLEIPLLRGGFKYYPNKDTNDKSESIMLDNIQVFFI